MASWRGPLDPASPTKCARSISGECWANDTALTGDGVLHGGRLCPQSAARVILTICTSNKLRMKVFGDSKIPWIVKQLVRKCRKFPIYDKDLGIESQEGSVLQLAVKKKN
jgi:hypothetical protein